MTNWRIFTGVGEPHNKIATLPEAPSWRNFEREFDDVEWVDISREMDTDGQRRGASFRVSSGDQSLVDVVNAALYLRRPLLITGKPGTGKTSLAYRIAYELNLGAVLSWPITARSTLQDGLYRYDAIERLQDVQIKQRRADAQQRAAMSDPFGEEPTNTTPLATPTTPSATAERGAGIGRYIQLGPLGTALLPTSVMQEDGSRLRLPRVLLIDEFDKSDINLPNDLLNLFEEGKFEIPELARIAKETQQVRLRSHDGQEVTIKEGQIRCAGFPLIILTSNGERDFPPAFKRRCLRLTMPKPNKAALTEIVKAHLGEAALQEVSTLIADFAKKQEEGDLSPDQLLNVVYLVTKQFNPDESDQKRLMDVLLKYLSSAEGE